MSDQDSVPKPGDTVEVVIRGTLKAASTATTETATSGELHLYNGSWLMFTDVDVKVNTVEPVYVDGGVYKDADGVFWRYSRGDNLGAFMPGWEAFGERGNYSLNAPKRPLRRVDS